jgi:hypothetical protein
MANEGDPEESLDSVHLPREVVQLSVRGGRRVVRVRFHISAIQGLKIAGGRSPILLPREESKEVADLPGGGAVGVARVELYRRPVHRDAAAAGEISPGETSAGASAGVPWEDRTAAAAWDAAAAGTGTDAGPAHAAPVRACTGADRAPGTAHGAAAGIAGQANTAALAAGDSNNQQAEQRDQECKHP